MIKLKIKKGDNVKIITGDDKGKTGESSILSFSAMCCSLEKGKNLPKRGRESLQHK